jgi:hypothetical protein
MQVKFFTLSYLYSCDSRCFQRLSTYLQKELPGHGKEYRTIIAGRYVAAGAFPL